MAKRKRTDQAKEISGTRQSEDPLRSAPNDPVNEDPQEERHLNRSSSGNEDDALESRHLARSRAGNIRGSSRMWGYKNGDGPSPESPSNEGPFTSGDDDRKLNSDQVFEGGSTTTGKRSEEEDAQENAKP